MLGIILRWPMWVTRWLAKNSKVWLAEHAWYTKREGGLPLPPSNQWLVSAAVFGRGPRGWTCAGEKSELWWSPWSRRWRRGRWRGGMSAAMR